MSTPYNSTSNLISSTPFTTPSLTSRSSLESTSSSSFSALPVPKDFSTAFGALSSTYGAGGSAPTPLHHDSLLGSTRSSSRTLPLSATGKKSWKSRIFPASCQVTPPPASAQSQRRTASAPRDYESAFGALQTDYGLQGMAPQLNRQAQIKSL